MLDGFVGGLLVSFILTMFKANKMLIEVAQPYFKEIKLTNSHYYIAFGLIGLISGIF